MKCLNSVARRALPSSHMMTELEELGEELATAEPKKRKKVQVAAVSAKKAKKAPRAPSPEPETEVEEDVVVEPSPKKAAQAKPKPKAKRKPVKEAAVQPKDEGRISSVPLSKQELQTRANEQLERIQRECRYQHSIKIPFELLVEPPQDHLQRTLNLDHVEDLTSRLLVKPAVPTRPPFVNCVRKLYV